VSRVPRREALRRLGWAALTLGGAGLLARLGVKSAGRFHRVAGAAPIRDHRVPDDSRYPSLVVARGPDPAELVRRAVDALGGMKRFVRPGETVLVKPNMAWDRSPEQGANTHPDVVAEVVRLARAAGARRVIVAEVPVQDGRRAAARSGIGPAVRAAGAELVLPDGTGFLPADLHGSVLARWEVLAPALAVDRVINVPVVKDHALSALTCGMKNWYGLLGGTRSRLHQRIHPSIADLAAAFLPTLTVVDATRVMIRSGPTGGRLEDVVVMDAVAAGTDPVACDTWAASLLKLAPADVPYLVLAEGKGLGSCRAGLSPVEVSRGRV